MQSQTRRILIPYSIVILFAYIGFSLPLPIFPEMFLDPARSIIPDATLGKRMVLLGVVMASFPFGQFFGSPFLGRLSDHYGRKKIILFSLTGTTLSYVITAISVKGGSIVGMFFGLALCGFCEGNVTIAQSVVADLTHKEHHAEKAKHFGWINIFISLGFVIGPLIGGQMADPKIVPWFSFATPFWFAAALTLLGILVIFAYSKETLQKEPKEKLHFFTGLQRPQLKMLFGANFFLALSYFSFFRFFPVFLERQFHFNASMLSIVMVYDSLVIAAGVIWLIPHLSKRFKPISLLTLFSFLLSITSIICILPASPYALIGTLVPVGLCLSVCITYGALLISNAASQHFQGQAMGTLTSVQVLAEFITGLAGGFLAASTLTLPLYAGAAMAIISSLILLKNFNREKEHV